MDENLCGFHLMSYIGRWGIPIKSKLPELFMDVTGWLWLSTDFHYTMGLFLTYKQTDGRTEGQNARMDLQTASLTLEASNKAGIFDIF